MSQYKSFFGPRNNTTLFKAQNQRSAIDIQPILYSYRHNERRDEYVYSGRISVNITSDNDYATAYIPKGEVKVIFGSILAGNFSKIFPEGHKIFGGSTVDGKIQSRVLTMRFNGGRFEIGIDVMEGRRTKQGAITPAGKPFIKVLTILQPVQVLEMAHEVLDFIRAAEINTLNRDLPLYTMNNISRNTPNLESDGVQQGAQNTSNSPTSLIEAVHQDVNLESMSNDEFKKYYRALKEKYVQAQNEVDIRTRRFQENQQAGNQ